MGEESNILSKAFDEPIWWQEPTRTTLTRNTLPLGIDATGRRTSTTQDTRDQRGKQNREDMQCEHAQIFKDGSGKDIIARMGSMVLLRFSFHRLKPGIWVNNEVNHFFL